MGVLLKRPHWNTSLSITVKAAAGSRGKCKDSFQGNTYRLQVGQSSVCGEERETVRSQGWQSGPALDRNSPV